MEQENTGRSLQIVIFPQHVNRPGPLFPPPNAGTGYMFVVSYVLLLFPVSRQGLEDLCLAE
jgi:hypothetical protein